MRSLVTGLVLAVAVLVAGHDAIAGSAAPEDPLVMRLIPVSTAADSIVLRLEFENVGRAPVRLWMPPDGWRPGWDLRLNMTAPSLGRRVLVPAIRYARASWPADTDMVVLAPGARTFAVLALRGGRAIEDTTGRRLYAWWPVPRSAPVSAGPVAGEVQASFT